MTVAEKETVSGNLRSAGINTVMGVGTVFVVLLFLVFVISLFKYVGKIGSGEEKKETEKKTPRRTGTARGACTGSCPCCCTGDKHG